MPSYTAGALERSFTKKLQADVAQGSRHRRIEFFDDAGNLVASTVFSRSWRQNTALSAQMISVIQRELKLQGESRLFADLVRCPLTREAWLERIGGVAQSHDSTPERN